MPLPLKHKAFILRHGATRIAPKIGVTTATLRRWIDDDAETPPYITAAISNIINGRAPAEPITFMIWENVERLGVDRSTYYRWLRDNLPPLAARHAMRDLLCRRNEFREHHANACHLIARSKLRKHSDRQFRDPTSGDTMNAATFETLKEMGLAQFSPKFRCIMLTAKGRERLMRWNARNA